MFQEFTPIEYLKIDIANNYGHDKLNWDERIDWVSHYEDHLEQMLKDADEPALYYAGVQAYRKAQRGEAVSYPISLDATASGAQLLALLIGCEQSAKLCNVIDTGSREDFYTRIYEAMLQRIDDSAKLTRKQVKSAIVPWFYGSKALPRKVFGEGTLLQTFLATIADEAPGVDQLNQALLGLWRPDALTHDWVLPDNFHVHVKVMDEHKETVHFLNRPYEVVTKVNRPTEEGLSIGANVIHSIDGMVVREIQRRCNFKQEQYDQVKDLLLDTSSHEAWEHTLVSMNTKMVKKLLAHYRESGFMSARIIDHIDRYSIMDMSMEERQAVMDLMDSMPEKAFPVISVHDCFRVHPNYGNDLRRQYNQILHEIAKSSLLENLASQIAGTDVTAGKFADMADDVLEANYALS